MSMARTLSAASRHTWALVWTAISVVPFLFIVLLAFKPTTEIYVNPVGIIGAKWRPENFVEAWIGPPGGVGFSSFLWNSAIALVVSLALSLLIGSVTAFFLSLAQQRVRRAVLKLTLLAAVTSVVMLLIPYYQAAGALGVLSNPWALAIFYAAVILPNTIMIMYSFYLGFPRELTEAASLDGLGLLATFRRIVLPLSLAHGWGGYDQRVQCLG